MVMSWDSEADAKLFAAFMATTDAKANCAEIAKYMGPDCTPKAVSHRIAKFRDLAKALRSSLEEDDNNTPANTPTKSAKSTGSQRKRKANLVTGTEGNVAEKSTAKTVKKAKTNTSNGKSADSVGSEEISQSRARSGTSEESDGTIKKEDDLDNDEADLEQLRMTYGSGWDV